MLRTLTRHSLGLRGLRYTSTIADPATSGKDIDASKIRIEKTKHPKELLPNDKLKFGHNFADHMLSISWKDGKGWDEPAIVPYGPFQMDPSCIALHYGFQLFEGMKAYKDKNGKVRLFRPNLNMTRMNNSARRIALPGFNGEELTKCIGELVKLDSRWIPTEKGYSLYLRPTMIATTSTLGVAPPDSALLYVISSPVGPYYASGFAPVSLYATIDNVRAWPGGTGEAKIGGNYAPCVMPQRMAAANGYHQNLWLFGPEHRLTEVGTMNLFIVWKNEHGQTELVTPPLDGTILPGVTRDSILKLAPELLPDTLVSQRHLTMPQLVAAHNEGRLMEVFGAGTAAIVSPVERISYMGKDLAIPTGPGGIGHVAKVMSDRILAIQYGELESDWSVVV